MSKSIILDVVLADPKAEIEIELNTRSNVRKDRSYDYNTRMMMTRGEEDTDSYYDDNSIKSLTPATGSTVADSTTKADMSGTMGCKFIELKQYYDIGLGRNILNLTSSELSLEIEKIRTIMAAEQPPPPKETVDFQLNQIKVLTECLKLLERPTIADALESLSRDSHHEKCKSIREWAERSYDGNKSIIEWAKTLGSSNPKTTINSINNNEITTTTWFTCSHCWQDYKVGVSCSPCDKYGHEAEPNGPNINKYNNPKLYPPLPACYSGGHERSNKRRQARNDKHSNVSYEKNKRRR